MFSCNIKNQNSAVPGFKLISGRNFNADVFLKTQDNFALKENFTSAEYVNE